MTSRILSKSIQNTRRETGLSFYALLTPLITKSSNVGENKTLSEDSATGIHRNTPANVSTPHISES